jgi:hypothetical protein
MALATPTQTSASLDGGTATLVAHAVQQSQLITSQTGAPQSRPGLGNREADGGWCISWCKERYWGEIIAAGCGVSGIIKVTLIIFLLKSGQHIVCILADNTVVAFKASYHTLNT